MRDTREEGRDTHLHISGGETSSRTTSKPGDIEQGRAFHQRRPRQLFLLQQNHKILNFSQALRQEQKSQWKCR